MGDLKNVEPTVWGMMRDLYSGRNAWLGVLVTVLILGFLALAIYSALCFFDATETRGQILWAATFLFSVQMLLAGKIWGWLEIHKKTILRAMEQCRG